MIGIPAVQQGTRGTLFGSKLFINNTFYVIENQTIIIENLIARILKSVYAGLRKMKSKSKSLSTSNSRESSRSLKNFKTVFRRNASVEEAIGEDYVLIESSIKLLHFKHVFGILFMATCGFQSLYFSTSKQESVFRWTIWDRSSCWSRRTAIKYNWLSPYAIYLGSSDGVVFSKID